MVPEVLEKRGPNQNHAAFIRKGWVVAVFLRLEGFVLAAVCLGQVTMFLGTSNEAMVTSLLQLFISK